MTLREALKATYSERFGHKEAYLEGKLSRIDELESTHDLIYFCTNLDREGMRMVSEKLGFDEFDNFISNYLSIDQGIEQFV